MTEAKHLGSSLQKLKEKAFFPILMRKRLLSLLPLILSSALAVAGEPEHPNGTPEKKDLFGDPLPEGVLQRFGSIRLRHPQWARTTIFLRDNKVFATGGGDGCVRFWDVATGKELSPRLHFPDHKGINSIALSPDGKALAVAGESTVVCVWEVGTGKLLHQLEMPWGMVNALSFSPDGHSLMAAGPSRFVQVWEMPSGKDRGKFQDCRETLESLAISPDSKKVAVGTQSGRVMVWGNPSGKLIHQLQAHNEEVGCVAFSPNGRILASGSHDKTIRLWDSETGKEVRQLRGHNMGVRCLSFSPDGQTLVSGSLHANQPLRLWDVRTGKELRRFVMSPDGIGAVAFSPDGKTIAAASLLLYLFDVKTGRQLQPHPSPLGGITSLAFSPDGKILASGSTEKAKVRLWDVGTGKELGPVAPHSENVFALAFSPCGKFLASGDDLGTVRLLDVTNRRKVKQFAIKDDGVTSLAFSPDGKILAVGTWKGNAYLWEIDTGRELQRFQLDPNWSERWDHGVGLCFSKDRKSLFTRTGRILCQWDVATGKQLRVLSSGKEIANTLQTSLDRRLGVCWGPAGQSELWDLTTGRLRRVFSGDLTGPFAFSPDGKYLAEPILLFPLIQPADRFPFPLIFPGLRVLEIASDKDCLTFGEGHQAKITCLAFSPDGKTVATGSEDTTILIWDLTHPLGKNRAQLRTKNPRQKRDYWIELASKDTGLANQTIWDLVRNPHIAFELFGKKLQAVRNTEPKQIRLLINRLNEDDFYTRQSAYKELEKLNEVAEPFLKQKLKGPLPTESRVRIETLLRQLKGPISSPEVLQTLRAIVVLERIGSPKAQNLLKRLSQGAPESLVTQEAQAALDRLRSQRGNSYNNNRRPPAAGPEGELAPEGQTGEIKPQGRPRSLAP